MPSRHFCTLFDRGYVFKGVAMLRSLYRHCPDAHVHVLCLDEDTRRVLLALRMPALTCIPLADLEDPVMLEVKKTRNVAEYCWTLTPCLWVTWCSSSRASCSSRRRPSSPKL